MVAFKAGDKAYIVENNRIVRQCTVIRVNTGMYLIRFERQSDKRSKRCESKTQISGKL